MAAPQNTPDSAEVATAVRKAARNGAIVIGLLTFSCSAGALSLPLFSMQVFSSVLPTRDLATLSALAVGAGLCLLIWGMLELLRSMAQELLATRIVTLLSQPTLRAAAWAPRSDLAAAEALADLETIRSFLTGRSCLAPFDIAMAPLLIVALLAMHWALALLSVVCILLLALTNWLGDAISRRALMAANEASATALRGAADAVNAAEPVLAMGMLGLLSRRWTTSQAQAAALVHGAVLRSRAVTAASSALRLSMTGAMVAMGLILTLNGFAASGSMVFGNMVLARLLLPFGSIANTRRLWIDAAAAWHRVQQTLGTATPRRNVAALPRPTPRLSVENLSYVPPGGDRPLLRSVSFAVEAGEALAIIGPSAAGKSTLLRLLAGIMPPTAGGAYLDGSSTFLWEREDFARHVGYVPQRPALLEESVAENIARMQAPNADAVLRAAKRAGLHGAVANLPRGYATIVCGGILSGGQRQQLALARALYGDPALVILDEPSAFLDNEAEAGLSRALAQLRAEGVTIILATHRPSLLTGMDKVLVLQNGVVERFGPVEDIRPVVARRPVRVIRSARQEVLAT